MAGELEIISSDNIKSVERDSRLAFKKKWYSSIYQWQALLDFYAAFVRQVELGQKKWGDDTVRLEVQLLSKHVKPDIKNPHQEIRKIVERLLLGIVLPFRKTSVPNKPLTLLLFVFREFHHFCAAC